MTPGERLRQARKEKKLSQAQVGEPLGFPYSKIRDLESGKQKLTLELAKGFEEMFSISSSWLLYGEEPSSNRYRDPQAGADRPSTAFDIPRSTGKIPIVSWAQAGPSGFFEDAFPAGSGFGEVNRPYDVTDPEAYALIISGDSMAPKYEAGDLIVVSPSVQVQTGDYAVVRLKDGTVSAKRIKEKNDRYVLESVNPDFQPRECQKEEVVFLHRIVWVKQRG